MVAWKWKFCWKASGFPLAQFVYSINDLKSIHFSPNVLMGFSHFRRFLENPSRSRRLYVPHEWVKHIILGGLDFFVSLKEVLKSVSKRHFPKIRGFTSKKMKMEARIIPRIGGTSFVM